MEDYNKKLTTYNDYQGLISAASEKNLAKAESQREVLGDISRADKESILSLGTVLEEDYTVKYGYRSVTLGHEGDLVVSWDALVPNTTHSTIQVQAGEQSGSTYKVANLHIFEDFKDFSEMAEYQSENGWDCLNINVDDANGVIIIPKALIDRIAMIEIDVAEVDANDTVTVSGQNSLFRYTRIPTVATRFFDGYTDGAYWYTASTVFESTATVTGYDSSGVGCTFTYADGTTDNADIKNPLNVNHYVFARYSNPNERPEEPEEVSTSMMGLAEIISRVEVFGTRLSSLLGLPEREIKKNDPVPAPYVPVVPAADDEIPDDPAPLADPEAEDEDPGLIPVPVSTAAEKTDGHLASLVHYEVADDEVPMASGAYWALVNRILSVLTALLALVSLMSRREKEDEEKETRVNLSVVLPAAASVVLFILTEDLRNPMALTDVWTPLMLVLLIANCILSLRAARIEKKTGA